jgi:membrane-associated phospholipid phosphatase
LSASLDRRRHVAAAGFVLLLLLSVFWPSPVVSINRLWFHQHLDVDELSFLGREAPSWDVVFWCIAGLFTAAVLASGEWLRSDFAAPFRPLRKLRLAVPRRFAIGALGGVLAVAVTWWLFDGPLIALAETLQSDATEDVVRIMNRFGGGANPGLIVAFFFIAGVVYRHRAWTMTAIAMAISGLGAGILAQIVKKIVGRSRPELWIGTFEFTRDAASSFPSGHTVGAFALAGAILFTSTSRSLRAIALFLAAAVGLSRIFAFRHWPSDVLASALLGLLVAALVSAGVTRLTKEAASHP